MHIPLNVIHWYIGLPVVALIAIRSLKVARKTHNLLNTYLGLGAASFTICLLFYGLPPLFSTNSQLLTITTIIADAFQFIALFWVWLAVARIYAPKSNVVRWVIIVLEMLMIGLGMYFSITENLATPVVMSQLANGTWHLEFAFSFGYQLVTAFQYLSLLLLGAHFLLDGWRVKDVNQKLRLWGLAFGFAIVGANYVSRPFLGGPDTSVTQANLMAAGLAVTGIFIIATIILNGLREKNKNSRLG